MSTMVLQQQYPHFEEEREMFFVGVNEDDLAKYLSHLDISKICNCGGQTQYNVKVLISNEYSSRGLIAKKIEVNCLRCGKRVRIRPTGDEALVKVNKPLF